MISSEEFLEISRSLEEHHSVFYALWDMGKPEFTDEIDTAAIEFNKEGQNIRFLFNPDFWKSCDDYKKKFVICHECLHVILQHGLRTKNNENPLAVNQALDVVVNHSLLNQFGFNRNKVEGEQDLCWTNTVLKGKHPDNKNYEYYYQHIKADSKQQTIDLHDSLGDFSDIINKLNGKLSPEEKESIKSVVEKHFTPNPNLSQNGAGTGEGGQWVFSDAKKIVKRKWETVIKEWSKKYLDKFNNVEQWARVNRRFTFMDGDLLLPSEMEVDEAEDDIIDVWFFQDTSGSCSGFINRFFAAALSLPKEKFNVKMHCFDTSVYETTLESKKLYGFGGTSFHPIESYIQEQIKEKNIEYPKAVFIITDGFGTKVNPQMPKRWYWFLSTNYSSCIPKECNIFQLKDYE